VRNGEYGLGVDIGDGDISAAVCRRDDGGGAAVAEVLPLGVPGATAAARLTIGVDGRVEPAPADDAAAVTHVMAGVGVPAPLYAGDRPVAAADVAAGAVQWVRELATARAGRPDAWTVVTVPPSWGGHRRAELARALESAGVPRFSLVSAAVAATHHHVATGDLPAEPTVAVYDLGATTLDTAVVGPTAEEALAHLAVPPAPRPWGGRDVDDAVLAHVRRCLGTPDGDPPARTRGRTLRAACVAAKEALSSSTVVDVAADGAPGPIRLTREELDEVLTGPVLASVEALADAVDSAGRTLDQLDGIVLAGGGVRVPLVAETLSGELGRPLLVAADPAMTAALGAAALAAEALAMDELVADQPVPVASVPDPVADDGPPQAALAVDGPPADGPDERRRLRRRVRTAPPARTSTPRPVGRTPRLKRSAVVTGAFLGLVLLPPTLAGVLGADETVPPSGQAVAEAQDDDGPASGTVGADAAPGPTPAGEPAARRAGSAAGAGRATVVAPFSSSPATRLAAALTTAAPTSSAVAGTSSSGVAGTSAPRSTVPPATAAGTTPPSSGDAQPPGRPPTQTPPSVETPPAETPPPVETPPAETPPPVETPPAETPPPVETPPSETPPPVETPPAEPPPADPAPIPEATAPAVAAL
jgi:actin-like ATPase involved in cell morphogenesis